MTEDTITVTATNTLQTADIQFTKSYSGGVLEGSKGNESEVTFAEFTLTAGGESAGKVTRTNHVYTTADDAAGGALKYGVVYTLKETTAPAGYTPMADKYLKLIKDTNGYKVVECIDATGTAIKSDGLSAVVDASGVANLTPDGASIVNNVIKGEFTFTKAFNSDAEGVYPTFKVYEATNNNGSYSYIKTEEPFVTVIDTDHDRNYTISNLECGKYYAVVEDKVTNYEPLTFYLSVQPDGDEDSLPEVTVVQTVVNEEVVKADSVWNNNTLTNQVKRAALTLTKTYDDKATNLIGNDTAVFNVYNDAAYTGSPVMTVNSGYTFSNLECGKTYYVKETAPAGYHGVAFEIVVTDKNGTAVAETQNAVMLGPDGNKTNISVSINNNTLDNKIKTTSFSFTKEYVGWNCQ